MKNNVIKLFFFQYFSFYLCGQIFFIPGLWPLPIFIDIIIHHTHGASTTCQ